jgi:micrococcal nuclease
VLDEGWQVVNWETVTVASLVRTIRLLGMALLCVAFWVHPVCGDDLPNSGRVKAVFDGDTVLLESGERVRYLGIDAPEVAHKRKRGDCYGDQARAANSNWVLHQTVRLEYDRETRDGYGRLLAYVWLADGACINAALLRGGFAWLMDPPMGLKRHHEFLEAQREALSVRRGMWSACSFGEEPFYPGNRRSEIFHRPGCPQGQKVPRKHQVKWESRWPALEQGYRPCRRCKP